MPTGRTPLTDAVERAAAELASTDRPATVILISDGVESCDRDPCSAAATLERTGIGFTAHVVGFGVGAEEAASLACIAEQTGGLYLSATNAGELVTALGQIATAVETESEAQPEPVPEVTVTAPERALAGEAFAVSWTGAVSGSDFVTIVAAGADAGTIDNHLRVRDGTEGDLRAPGTPGLYEVRYVLDEGRRTLATAMIEVTEPEVAVTAPERALAGEAFAVSWTGAVSGSGMSG